MPLALVEEGVIVALPVQRQLGLPGQVLLVHVMSFLAGLAGLAGPEGW